MILVVGGKRGGGKVCAELLQSRGHEVCVMGKGDACPAVVPQAIAFYQRDRENEFQAGVDATRNVVRHYVAQGMKDSALVLIGSTTIHEDDASPNSYRLTKTAMLALTKQYAKEFKDLGIRLNMVSPGDFRKGPMTALDVAEVVSFLLSWPARFITGQEIVVRA